MQPMSDTPEEKEPEVTSVFAESEPPEEGAAVFDEAPVEKDGVDEEGHLRKTVSTEGEDLHDHSDELEAELAQQQADGTAPPPMPEREPIGIRSPVMMSDPADAVREEIEKRFQEEFNEEIVTVSPTERDAFVRAALHDSELTFDVEIAGLDTSVTIAIPSDAFTSAAAAASYEWARKDYITKDSDLQWILTFQQMHAWFQVRAIDGKPTAWASDWDGDIPNARELRALLEDPANIATIQNMNSARWRLILQAIRTAEQKYKLCLANWQDRTFFTGADTD